MYEILAQPAHAWLWLCAKACGGEYKHETHIEHHDGA